MVDENEEESKEVDEHRMEDLNMDRKEMETSPTRSVVIVHESGNETDPGKTPKSNTGGNKPQTEMEKLFELHFQRLDDRITTSNKQLMKKTEKKLEKRVQY